MNDQAIKTQATMPSAGSLTAQQARRRILSSWIVGSILVVCFGFALFLNPHPPSLLVMLATAVGLFYMGWSIFWGLCWTRDRIVIPLARKTGSPGLVVFLAVILFYVLFTVAVYYGVLGGGIYQFVKHRRLAITGA